ncbi:hypothetical protein NLU13_6899 [Sarocladium strictum]|uniref:Uncharacterized protein n=1 Tax=Sarocladium strictum TaxID=5046 RepID=A0AA39GGL1_SARSR|nr:hypothetical protein NLU13_6899 [Sarocladium strictum]
MANQGGDLFDMAKDGTKIPRNAGKPRAIPSVPNPGDNDAPALDTSNEVTTATGDVLPESVSQKPTGNGGKEDDYYPAPKGGRNH